MKVSIILILIAGALIFSGCPPKQVPEEQVEVKKIPKEFEVMDEGAQSGYRGDLAFKIITDQTDFARTVGTMSVTVSRDLSSVDFNTQFVILALRGRKPTGGYSIEIQDVKREQNGLWITVKVGSPSKDAMVSQAFTSFYQMVVVEKGDLTGDSIIVFATPDGKVLLTEEVVL